MTALLDITHGAGGVHDLHRWNGALDINAQDLPRILVEKITGLHATPDRDDPRDSLVGQIGEEPYPTSPHGKTVVYSGELQAHTLAELRVMRTALIAAFADARAEGYMDIVPQLGDDSPSSRFTAKGVVDVPEDLTSETPIRSFTLTLRLADPRIYFPALAVDETGNPVAVTNPGSAPVNPIITVAGASGVVTVTDGTRTLKFRDVPSGSLVIDFAKSTGKVGTTDCELVETDSDWWDPQVWGIEPGAHSIAQTGGTGVRVQLTPAVWG